MTYHTLSDGLTQSSVKTFWPLWLSFLWICAVPFLSLYRVGPLPSFYLEAISLSGSLVLTLISAHKGLLNIRLPALSVGLFAMAAFLVAPSAPHAFDLPRHERYYCLDLCHFGTGRMVGAGLGSSLRTGTRRLRTQGGHGSIANCAKAANKLGVRVITVYAFSTENWLVQIRKSSLS